MNLTTLMKFELPADASMSETALFGLQVVAIGMGVVFGVLLILIAILQLFKLFAIEKKSEPKNDTVANVTSNNASAPAAPAAPVTVASVPASEEELVVAIATAAIAAARGESDCAFNVISIKKIVK